MTAKRWLIVNADDFGRSRGINRGVVKTHRDGIVTSASLMVRWPAAREAVELARQNPSLGLGLHIDLGEWRLAGGEWEPVYEIPNIETPVDLAREIEWQLEQFHSLVGRGPTHLDSHQHVHRQEPVRSALLEVSRARGVPLRECNQLVAHRGDFYGLSNTGEKLEDNLSVSALIDLIAGLQPGVSELGCHPGYPDGELTDDYVEGRRMEVEVLCDPQLTEALAAAGVALCSFDDLARLNLGEPT